MNIFNKFRQFPIKAENFSITIFGSARLPNSSQEFEFVSRLTQLLVEQIPVAENSGENGNKELTI